jgi:methionyl-tRNA formyltransferase
VRLAFLGTPETSVPTLRALVEAGHDIDLVVTRADRRRGRGSATSPSPVKASALELGLPVTHDIDDLLASDAELGVVVAYGRIIKPHVLAAVPMVNVHFSLLPRWRGAAPVERALLAGDERTGVCIMDVEETLDTGGVYACREVPIGPTTTAAELRSELVELGTELLVDVLAAPLPAPQPQVGDVTYAEKIAPDELKLAWDRPAIELDRWVRVGGAWTTFRGRRLKVHRASVEPGDGVPGELGADGTVGTGDRSLRLLTVQPEGKAAMPWADFANGAHPRPGEQLGR